jgi:hypothetical protein
MFDEEAESVSTEEGCKTESEDTESEDSVVDSQSSSRVEGVYVARGRNGSKGVFVPRPVTAMGQKATEWREIRLLEEKLDTMRTAFYKKWPRRNANVLRDSDISRPRSPIPKLGPKLEDPPTVAEGTQSWSHKLQQEAQTLATTLLAQKPDAEPRVYACSGLSEGEGESDGKFTGKLPDLALMSNSWEAVDSGAKIPDEACAILKTVATLLKEASGMCRAEAAAHLAARDTADKVSTGVVLGESIPAFAIAECAKGSSKSEQRDKPKKDKKKSTKASSGTLAGKPASSPGQSSPADGEDEDEDKRPSRRQRQVSGHEEDEEGTGQGIDEGKDPEPEDSGDITISPVSADGVEATDAYYEELADTDSPPADARRSRSKTLREENAELRQEMAEVKAMLSQQAKAQPQTAAFPEPDSKARTLPRAITKLNTRILDVSGGDRLELHDWLRELADRLTLCGLDVNDSSAVHTAACYFKVDSVLHHWWQQWKGEHPTPGSVAEFCTVVTEQFPLAEAERETAKNRLRNLRRSKYSSYVEFQNAFSKLTRLSGLKERELLLQYYRDALPTATRNHITSMELTLKAAGLADKLSTLQQYHTACAEFESKAVPTFVKQDEREERAPHPKRRRERAGGSPKDRGERPKGPPSAGKGKAPLQPKVSGKGGDFKVPQWAKDLGVSQKEYNERRSAEQCIVCGSGKHIARLCPLNKGAPAKADGKPKPSGGKGRKQRP